ncbi:MAG: hypothetical protein ACREN5_03175 [Gemmatimonadales bacterium]
MKRSTAVTLAVIALIIVLFLKLTMGGAREECRVCMEFRGLTNCATATGPARDAATDGARTTACGTIASGMNETIACGNTAPASVQCKTR